MITKLYTLYSSYPMMSKLKMVIAPIVLVLVAVNQLYLSTAKDISPWKGGGFGMFAQINNRFPVIFLTVNDQDVRLLHTRYFSRMPQRKQSGLWTDSAKISFYPSERILKKTSKKMFKDKWIYVTHYYKGELTRYLRKINRIGLAYHMIHHNRTQWLKENGDIVFIPDDAIQQIKIELWEYEFNAATMTLDPKKIRHYISEKS